MGAAILTEAALGFLGFGIQRPDVSLGNLVEAYDSAFSSRPWLFLWPGVFIVVIVLCLQFIGDGLRDAFDPRQKRVPKRKDLEQEITRAEVGNDEPVADPTRARRARGDVKHYAMSPTTPSATSTAPPASVPRCQRTGTRSCSSTGLSR